MLGLFIWTVCKNSLSLSQARNPSLLGNLLVAKDVIDHNNSLASILLRVREEESEEEGACYASSMLPLYLGTDKVVWKVVNLTVRTRRLVVADNRRDRAASLRDSHIGKLYRKAQKQSFGTPRLFYSPLTPEAARNPIARK